MATACTSGIESVAQVLGVIERRAAISTGISGRAAVGFGEVINVTSQSASLDSPDSHKNLQWRHSSFSP